MMAAEEYDDDIKNKSNEIDERLKRKFILAFLTKQTFWELEYIEEVEEVETFEIKGNL
jgi:hypothetical protein